MNRNSPGNTNVPILTVVLCLIGSLSLTGAERPTWTKRDKAYFADENTIAFVRPGLVIDLVSAEIAGDGTVTAVVKYTDPMGLPLDKDGVFTPGVINSRWTVATIKQGDTQYYAYTNRIANSPITGDSAEQATNDGRFVMITAAAEQEAETQSVVVLDRFDELKRLAPTELTLLPSAPSSAPLRSPPSHAREG